MAMSLKPTSAVRSHACFRCSVERAGRAGGGSMTMANDDDDDDDDGDMCVSGEPKFKFSCCYCCQRGKSQEEALPVLVPVQCAENMPAAMDGPHHTYNTGRAQKRQGCTNAAWQAIETENEHEVSERRFVGISSSRSPPPPTTTNRNDWRKKPRQRRPQIHRKSSESMEEGFRCVKHTKKKVHSYVRAARKERRCDLQRREWTTETLLMKKKTVFTKSSTRENHSQSVYTAGGRMGAATDCLSRSEKRRCALAFRGPCASCGGVSCSSDNNMPATPCGRRKVRALQSNPRQHARGKASSTLLLL